jgi:hypothetical protein
MIRTARAHGIAAVAVAWIALGERQASACGGCFHPPTQTVTDITDERMLLSVSPAQTTLYDQIRYSGSPSSFAWVLPIHGTVTVGLSADILFDSIDALTQTQIVPPPSSCPTPPQCSGGGCGASNNNNAPQALAQSAGGGSDPNSVIVTKQDNVGPYATVQLHSTDAGALSTWLAQNGFVIPDDVTPVLDAYVREGFDFLAMKLLPNEGVQAMRPVRVSSAGASLSLPLRMAAIGTGDTVGITIWVVADGRYEPQNFPFYRISDADLVWDWAATASNYTTLRAKNETALGHAGWEIESSITLNQQIIASAITSGGTFFPGGSGANTLGDPDQDYLPVMSTAATTGGGADGGDASASPVGNAAVDGGGADAASADAASADDASADDAGANGDGTIIESAGQVRAEDIRTLFAGLDGPNVRVTRFRGDIAHAAMNADLVLRASADQSEISNVRTPTKSINETCPIYDGCDVVGTGTPAQSQASVHKSGCAASPHASAGRSSGLAALSAGLALVIARSVRARRRRARTPQR